MLRDSFHLQGVQRTAPPSQFVVTKNWLSVGEYFYDGEGKRVRKVEWEGTAIRRETIFVYSAGKLVEEYSTEPVTGQCKLQNAARRAALRGWLTPIAMRAVG